MSVRAALVAFCCAILFSCLALAQTAADLERGARLNNNTVTIVSGNPNGTYLATAYDISAVLDDGDNLRILPVIGKGGAQNVRDVLYLKGVDMGITQSNILKYFKKSGEFGKNIEQRLRYIARLYNEELHILVRNEVNSIEDLQGQKVNFSDAGSGTQLSAQLIFEALGVRVTETNYGQADAIEKLKAGEIAASLLIAGKPTAAYAKLGANSGFKFLPFRYTSEVSDDYFPAVLTSEDYPQLIPKDTSVQTIAVGAVLAVFNWQAGTDRHRRVARFVTSFFEKFDQFQKAPRHVKWRESNLAADLPGWTRFSTAQEILDKEKVKRVDSTPKDTNTKVLFEAFLKQSGQSATSNEARDQLFRSFLEWQKTQKPR